NARVAEVALNPLAGRVIVAEEGERRPGVTDDRPDVLAAVSGKDGVARRFVRQEHVEAGAAQRVGAAAADAAAWRNPLAGAGGAVVNCPQGADGEAARESGDAAVADAAQLAVCVGRETGRVAAGAPLQALEPLVIFVIAGGEPHRPGARLGGEDLV